jgi:hypothetical protein
LDKGDYKIVLKWHRNHKYLFGSEGNRDLEWKYAMDDNGKISVNNGDSLGDNNFYSSLNSQTISISKIPKNGDVYDKLINKFRPKIHIRDIYNKKHGELYSADYSYLILRKTFSKYTYNLGDLYFKKLGLGFLDDDSLKTAGYYDTENNKDYFKPYSSLDNWKILENISLNTYNPFKDNLLTYQYPSYLSNIQPNASIVNGHNQNWGLKYYNVNFFNILSTSSNTDNINSYYNKLLPATASQRDLGKELDFIPTFDVNDAYINEDFFKTYGIITQSGLLDKDNNFTFKKDDLSIKHIDISSLSDFDISILYGKHFAVFKCNVLMEDIYPYILPYNATTGLSEGDILNAGKMIFKPNNTSGKLTFANKSDSGFLVELNKNLNFDKIKKFPYYFKVWLKYCSHLDFTIKPDTEWKWSQSISNVVSIGYHQSNISDIDYNNFTSLIVSKNLEPFKGTGFPNDVTIELDYSGDQPGKDFFDSTLLTFFGSNYQEGVLWTI